MIFQVQRPFNLDGIVRMPGQIVELNINRAARLRSMGLIGLVESERATRPPTEQSVPQKPERAVKKPGERRGRKPKAQETQETVQDGAETDNTTGD